MSVILYSLVVSMFASVDLRRGSVFVFLRWFCSCGFKKKVSLKKVWLVEFKYKIVVEVYV
jgi:hypothetical protein